MLKVCLVAPSLAMGGVEHVLLNRAGGLSRHGILVDLVVSNASGTLRKSVPAGVRLIDLYKSYTVEIWV